MKVYLVWIEVESMESKYIHGIYSTKILAEKSFDSDAWRKSGSRFFISEYELDYVNEKDGKL